MDKNTILIVGLGNPGKEYKNTRHNIGFLLLDELQKQGFSDWQKKEKLQGEIAQGNIAQKKIILLKPLTYMNNSGESVKRTLSFYQIPINNLWIVNDDADLPFSLIRLSQDRGSAGHKGVESIIQHVKTKNFTRFRIGIKPKKDIKTIEKFVLEKFNIIEKRKIAKIQNEFLSAIHLSIEDGISKAMNNFN